MVDVSIKYNPYKVTTEININGDVVDSGSPLSFTTERRLQEWIEPRRHWGGIFSELRKCTGESSVRILFHGTQFDFADLEYAKEKYGSVFQTVEMHHINQQESVQNDPASRLVQLRKMYEELQNGPVEEFKTDDIKDSFEHAIGSDFEIVVVAPMSSGKSTLINAMLGQDLLPAVNEATTAVITRIRDNDSYEQFVVSAYGKDGKIACFRVNEDGVFEKDENGSFIIDAQGKPIQELPADLELISQMNYAKDPADTEGKNAWIQETVLEGNIPVVNTNSLKAVFVDTPGGNNAQNLEHFDLMERAIQDENKSLILYVFNGTQTGTNDSDAILELISEEMKRSSNGKQSRDRFLFVANRMDDFDPEKEDYENYIQNSIMPGLSKYGIVEPNLFLVSARLAKLLRMSATGQKYTRQDSGWLASQTMLFGDITTDDDDTYRLYKHSSLSNQDKDYFDKKIQQLISQNPSEEELPEVAEINSGLPALEKAIQDYLDKYAISIKLKVAHDSFMRKVKEREMIDSCQARWVSSKDELEKTRAELAEKQKKHAEQTELSEYKKKIDQITFDETKVLESQIDLFATIIDIESQYKNNRKVEKAQAQSVLLSFKHQAQRFLEEAAVTLEQQFNKEVLAPCQEIVKEYQQFIQTLENAGLFDLGGIQIQKIDDYEKHFTIATIDDLLKDTHFVKQEKHSTGRRKAGKKRGFFNAIRRWFGSDSGWNWEETYKTVTYVDVGSLVENQLSKLRTEISQCFNKECEDTENQISKLKEAAKQKLDGIDQMVANTMKAIEDTLKDEVALRDKVRDNERTLEWIQDFVKRVDAILDI